MKSLGLGGTGSASLSDPSPAWASGVSDTSEIREFLVWRRARLTPERAGLPRHCRKARVEWLRLEEVVLLADSQQWQRFSDPVRPPNAARYLFLDPRAKVFYADWKTVAHDIVAAMRSEAGRDPYPC